MFVNVRPSDGMGVSRRSECAPRTSMGGSSPINRFQAEFIHYSFAEEPFCACVHKIEIQENSGSLLYYGRDCSRPMRLRAVACAVLWPLASCVVVSTATVEVRRCASPLKGLGAFARGDAGQTVFSSGSTIGDYAGELMTEVELKSRYGGSPGSYIMLLCADEALFIDAENEEHADWTRCINHSEKRPNLVVERFPSERRACFVATRDIIAGEELLFDYGREYWALEHRRMLDAVLYDGAEYRPIVVEEEG